MINNLREKNNKIFNSANNCVDIASGFLSIVSGIIFTYYIKNDIYPPHGDNTMDYLVAGILFGGGIQLITAISYFISTTINVIYGIMEKRFLWSLVLFIFAFLVISYTFFNWFFFSKYL